MYTKACGSLGGLRSSVSTSRSLRLFDVHSHSSAKFTSFRHGSTTSSSSWSDRLPLIIRPSFWRSMIPKPLREIEEEKRRRNPNRQEWNPATYFILVFLLIGSNAIHFVNLKRKYAIDSRQADNKIALLQEVIRKVQNGEEVNVESALGTGDPLAEQEWEDVVKKIEEEDRLWRAKQRRKEKRQAEGDSLTLEEKTVDGDAKDMSQRSYDDEELAPRKKRRPGFY